MRKWIIGVMFVLLAAGIYWRMRPKTSVLAEAYVGETSVTVWSSTAQVHESLGELHWGDSVEVLSRNGNEVKVRTPQRTEGWIESHSLLDTTAWQGEKALLQNSHAMPLQAAGHTKVFTNMHLEPGRDAARIYQFPGGVPVAVVARKLVAVPQASGASGSSEPAKREDWLLVYTPLAKSGDARAAAADSGSPSGPAGANSSELAPGSAQQSSSPAGRDVPTVAGWVLSRFVQLDYPEVIRDYASSSGSRPIAWFVLNLAGESVDPKPQYLMAGVHSGDEQDCDFSMLRVYTWDAPRQRYETALVQSDLCGFLPILVSRQAGSSDPEFRFKLITKEGAKEDALYRMRQTVVRRVRDQQPEKKRHR
jgi:hypothetical protein